MQNALIIFRQTCIMFVYIAIGFSLFRANLITKAGSASMASLLLYVVLPSVIINSFCVSSSGEKIGALLISLLAGTLLLIAAMVISHLLFRKNPINDFGVAFSNAGFMGFPLISALLGAEAVFYAAGFVAVLNALQWTYGQYLMSGDKSHINIKNVIKNPLVLSLLAGLLIFFSGLQVPAVVKSTFSALAAMNAPLAMIILGVYLAQMDFAKTFRDKSIYLASAARLLLIPVASFLLLTAIPGMGADMKSALFIAAMAPVGSNMAVYAQKQGLDYPYAVGLVCLSTVFSITTMPILILLTQM